MRGTASTPKRPNSGLYDKTRVGRRIKHARQDRRQSVETLATLVSDLSGENITPQMVKNIEAGRKRVDAAMLPVFAAAQRKSFAYYLLDDPAPGGYDLALIEAGLSPSKVVPLRKQKVVRSQIIPQVPQREAA